jgi:hypothetical protein
MATYTQRLTAQEITSIRTSNGLDLVAGAWLAISPFVLGFNLEQGALWNTLVTGIVIALFAAVRSFGEGYRYMLPSWMSLVAGIWLIAAPFFLAFGSIAATWNSVIVGVIVVALSGWSIAATPEETV